MSEFSPESQPQSESGIDILRFFDEDLDQTDRIELFRRAAERLRANIDKLATPENVEAINNNYDLTVVFNPHAGAIDVGQILRHIKQPFITFVEGTGARDIDKNPQFTHSVDSTFDLRFDNEHPKPPLVPSSQEFGHWEERGLLAKGSLILPIDVRHYARHMLNAIIGDDYSQDYLNARIGYYHFLNSDYSNLYEATRNRGLLVMQSNAVRELTSTKQVLDTLLMLQDDQAIAQTFGEGTRDKTIALRDKARRDGKLNAFIIYGSGHHAFTHEFRNRGINVTREFANKDDLPRPFKMLGSNLDQFFNAHHFKTSEENIDKYTKGRLLEDLLFLPLNDPDRYGIFYKSRSTISEDYYKILHLARSPELHERLESLIAEFKTDMWLPVKILAENGIHFNHLDSRE